MGKMGHGIVEDTRSAMAEWVGHRSHNVIWTDEVAEITTQHHRMDYGCTEYADSLRR